MVLASTCKVVRSISQSGPVEVFTLNNLDINNRSGSTQPSEFTGASVSKQIQNLPRHRSGKKAGSGQPCQGYCRFMMILVSLSSHFSLSKNWWSLPQGHSICLQHSTATFRLQVAWQSYQPQLYQLFPSWFDDFFALQNALQYLQLNKQLYRNPKTNNSTRENLISSKFNRIFLSYSLCPCSVPVWRSQHPNEEFPSLPWCCPLLPIFPNLDPSVDSTWFNGLSPEHLS